MKHAHITGQSIDLFLGMLSLHGHPHSAFGQQLTGQAGEVDQRREGDFVIRTRIDSFEIGEIKAYGNGLYLPVRMVGAASIDYRPAK